MRQASLTLVTFAAVAFLVNHARADIAPRSLSELRESEVIVVGTIKQSRIETEGSQFDHGFGNHDWAIYVTLAIEHVEKGLVKEPVVEFRCFRIKSRRSHLETQTPGGHWPIPGTGTRVRVYLDRRESNWSVALPNGITAPDANDDQSVWRNDSIGDAAEIAELGGLRYTYLLPLEIWGVILMVLLPVTLLATVVTCRLRRHKTGVSESAEQA
ncbi:MAG: hypothetical protein VX768_21245 [Planctomycetota bacterium]|nr:hypothetical protein [Planctomycetota bacterium]